MLKWIVALDHLGSNDLLRCILVFILNVYNLIVHLGGHTDHSVDLDEREVNVWEKDNGLLFEVLKAFAILGP